MLPAFIAAQYFPTTSLIGRVVAGRAVVGASVVVVAAVVAGATVGKGCAWC